MAALRDVTPSLVKMWLTWLATVFSLMIELLRDCPVGLASGEEPKDLQLALGETLE